MKRTAKNKPKINWSRVDAMSEARYEAALWRQIVQTLFALQTFRRRNR